MEEVGRRMEEKGEREDGVRVREGEAKGRRQGEEKAWEEKAWEEEWEGRRREKLGEGKGRGREGGRGKRGEGRSEGNGRDDGEGRRKGRGITRIGVR